MSTCATLVVRVRARSYELNAVAIAPVLRAINNAACANLIQDGGACVCDSQLMGNDIERNTLALRAPEVLERFSMKSALEKWDALLKQVIQT